MERSPIQSRHNPGGVYVIVDESKGTGKYFFVHSGTGSNSNDGGNPSFPLATVAAAIAKCTASKGDVIVCMPGHAETLISATTLAMSVAGVALIGLGRGTLRPTFTLATATSATLAVSGANCLIDNVNIVSDLADVAAGITATATADGLEVSRCYLSDGGAAKELIIGISLAAACDRVNIHDNEFYTAASGGCASAIKFVGAISRARIRNNYAFGDYSAAAIDGATAAGTEIDIYRNRLANLDDGAGLAVSLHASTTGQVIRNELFGTKTNTVPIAAAGCYVAQNLTAAAVAESGLLKPDAESYA